jgi:hypothetical protein
MKLSEAIRLGSMLHPQARHAMAVYEDTGSAIKVIATCALGAARQAGYEVTVLENNTRQCPACGSYEDFRSLWDIHSLVVHLNDFHGWSREHIADCVEQFEQGDHDHGSGTGEPCPCVAASV